MRWQDCLLQLLLPIRAWECTRNLNGSSKTHVVLFPPKRLILIWGIMPVRQVLSYVFGKGIGRRKNGISFFLKWKYPRRLLGSFKNARAEFLNEAELSSAFFYSNC